MELGENQKSLIIIGAGLNGLSAGIAYALNTELHHNDGVLILDKNPCRAAM
jgi:phytoene dehydrogenase-like protein